MRHQWKSVEFDFRTAVSQTRPLVSRCVQCQRWRFTYTQSLRTYYTSDGGKTYESRAGECPGGQSDGQADIEDSGR